MDFADFIEKGGVVMVVLIGLSIYAVTVIAYKIRQFMAGGLLQTQFVDPIMRAVKEGELTDAYRALQPIKGPVARIMRTSIECVRNRDISMRSREAEIARVGAQEMQYLESHLRGLEMVATTAPLLGLLGTVIGMVKAFAKLGSAGTRVDPSMLAGGIWEALLTTVGGLSVAIPAIAAYYIIDAFVERVRVMMKDVTIQILSLEDVFLKNEKEQIRLAEEKRVMDDQKRLSEQEKQKIELLAREEALKKAMEEQEKAAAALRTAPQATNTLRLLNPSYGKF